MSFNVLSKEVSVFGQFFLEASAGTGKTFAIEHITVRLLIESLEPITIDKILIVTFTRAATRDLKVRIRQALMQALQALTGKRKAADYLLPIIDKGEVAIFSAMLRIESALYDFDKAAIYTLHGFCHRMLTLHQFDAGIYIPLEEMDNSAFKQAMYSFVEDLLLTGIDCTFLSPCQLSMLIQKNKGPSALIKGVVKKMERGISIEGCEHLAAVLEALNSLGREVKSMLPKALKEELESFLLCFKGVKPLHVKQASTFLKHLFEGSVDVAAFDSLFEDKECFISLAKIENIKKIKHKAFEGLSCGLFFEKLMQSLSAIVAPAMDTRALILTLASECSVRWQRSPLFSQSFSADDLLLLMKKAIKDKALARKIADHFSALIIDEFQDTDPLQWDIFKALFFTERKDKAIYLVGDPKQSIYAFRSADVYTYLAAMDLISNDRRLRLDTNYRSTPKLVEALNALFNEGIASSWMPLPKAFRALQVPLVKAGVKACDVDEMQDRGALHFFIAEGHKKRSKQWPTEDLESRKLFPFIADEILSLHRCKGVSLSSFTVLVRDRFSGERLKRHLTGCGIACSFQQGFSLEKSLAFQALADLVAAVQEPKDISAIKKVLLGGMVSLEREKLAGGFDNPLMQKMSAYLTNAPSFIRERGWMAFVEDFLQQRLVSTKTLLEDILCRPENSFYEQLHYLLELCYSRGADMFSVHRLEDTLLNLPHEDIDESSCPLGQSSGDSVHIMTIHASKGLEFEIVFALGVAYRYRGDSDHITALEGNERRIKVFDENDPSCCHSLLEAEAEKVRQLYVALTRARQRVYIPILIDVEQTPVAMPAASAIELFSQGFGREHFDIKEAYSTLQEQTKERLTAHLSFLSASYSITFSCVDGDIQIEPLGGKDFSMAALPGQGYSPQIEKKSLMSFSSLHSEDSQQISSLEQLASRAKLCLPAGAETGTIIHELMEVAIDRGWHQEPSSSSLSMYVQQRLAKTALAGLDPFVLELVEKTFSLPLSTGKKTFMLRDIPSCDFFLEMEFAFSTSHGIMKGFIDAVCVYKGKYYLFDWKTNALEEEQGSYSASTIDNAMENNGYYLQAAIYREALRRYLARVEKRPFASCFGGAFYLFMRGGSYIHFFPEELEQCCKEKRVEI